MVLKKAQNPIVANIREHCICNFPKYSDKVEHVFTRQVAEASPDEEHLRLRKERSGNLRRRAPDSRGEKKRGFHPS